MIGRNWGWIVATLIVAVAVHLASVTLLPHLIMQRTMQVIGGRGGANTMLFGKRPTAESRGVVRPSPDLLYSSCVYDLSKGPVRVTASGMPDTYWSVSLFDAETNNFYVLNDRKAKNGSVDFLITPQGTLYGDRTKLPVVQAPTRRGLVLFRTLIDDDKRLVEIDRARRHASCGAAQP